MVQMSRRSSVSLLKKIRKKTLTFPLVTVFFPLKDIRACKKSTNLKDSLAINKRSCIKHISHL